MAQAARQSLRMQKELKLLLTDPPPGVSLSNDPSTSSPSSSLSNIDAEIKCPEGTVYANGVFKIKIQIPDRYPFQPPNVTFATPIYHPNIDNGGRICLDILNLPPKGAWQPSLNISTVLMSIGLLLSEPNPDDGLMCEASREYKYNRQTFDQKARSMTEKYAKSGITVGTTGSGGTPANPSPLMMEGEEQDLEPRNVDNEYNVDCKKLSRVNRKLSLESLGPSQKRNDDEKENTVHTDKSSFLYSQILSVNSSTVLPMPQVGIDDEQLSRQDNTKKIGNESINVSPEKLSGNVQKLSRKSFGAPLRVVNNDKENVAQTESFHTNTNILSVASSNPFQPRTNNHVDKQYRQDNEVDANNGSASLSRKKLSGIGRKLSLHSSCSSQKRKGDDHNVLHTQSSISLPESQSLCSMVSSNSSPMPLNDNYDRKEPHQVHNEKTNKGMINTSSKKSGISRKLSLEISTTPKWEDDDNKENVPPNYQLASENSSLTSSSFMMPHTGNYDAQSPQDHIQGASNGKLAAGHKKPFGISKKVLTHSSGLTQRKDANNKVDVLPAEKLSLLHYQSLGNFSSKSMPLPPTGAHDEDPHQHSREKAGNSNTKQNKDEESLITDSVIVLDSEDSDEEVKGPTRSRLSLARKPLAGKRKAKA